MIQSLATVRDAVREALRAAGAALAAGGAEAVPKAQGQWRSAHAAMQLVNHRALVQFSTELGALIPSPGTAAQFAEGSRALDDAIKALVAGQPDQPMRLWPAYEAMQRARGVAQSNQGDLFFPDVTLGPGDNPAAKALTADELRGARRVLEAGLLQWLRKGDIAGLKQVAAAVRRVESSIAASADRRLWWIARGVFEAVQQGALEDGQPLRRLVTQLNLQLGRLVQGAQEVPETLLRDALLLAARAQITDATPLTREVQRVYQLQGMLDVTPAPAAGGFSAEALAEARKQADGLQAMWAQCTSGVGGFADFEQRARGLAHACEALGVPALTALVAQLVDTAKALTAPGAKAPDTTALEGACALLMIEPVLTADHAPGEEFTERARNMAARLKVSVETPQALAAMPPAQLLDAESLRTLAVKHAAVVYAEIGRLLRDIELTLDGWFRKGSDPLAVSGLEKPFRQAAGALAVLGHADAAALTLTCRSEVAGYTQGAACGEAEQKSLAARLAALSAFVDAAQHGPAKLVLPGQTAMAEPAAAPAPPPAAAPIAETEAAAPAMPRLPTLDRYEPPPVAVAEPASPVPRAVPAPVAQEAVALDSAGDTDPEMLDIFLEEAGEVLNTIAGTRPRSAAQPQDQELLTELRRAFHTLKGSGRMVGLKNIGEAAYAMEQVFNELSADKRPGTPDLYRLVDFAHGDFTRWIGELREHKQARINSSQLIDFTKKLREGVALPDVLEAAPQADIVVAPVPIPGPEPVPGSEAPAAPVSSAAVIVEPAQTETLVAPPLPDTVQLGDITVGRTLYDIMLPEAQGNIAIIEAQNERVQNGVKVSADFLRAVHTLRGISGTAGIEPVRALAEALERVLQDAVDVDTAPHAEARKLIAQTVKVLAAQVASIAVPQAPAAHEDLIQALSGVSVGATVAAVSPVVAPAIATPVAEPAVAVPAPEPEALGHTLDFMAQPAARQPEPPPVAAVTPLAAVVAPLQGTSAVSATAPPVAAEAASGMTQLMASTHGGIERRAYRLKDDIDPQLLQIFLEEAAELVPQVGQDLRDWRARPADKLVPQSLKRLLHTLKGSARMAGAMALGQLTHSMESRVENAELLPAIPPNLFDDLETSFDRIGVLIGKLQGEDTEAPAAKSAPVAGAAPVVEAAHLSPAMDEMSRTMHMAAATGLTQMIPVQSAAADGSPVAGQPAAGVQRPLIRVRADLIDRLANQAGEVSIARARVSAELRSARGSLRDLTENIGRLRAQLRELEIAAETQMQSRFTPQPGAGGEKFDPLEFDRFTRLQELTRLMAESVNDVATVQHNLARDLDEGEKALASQAQITRDVQQDLMAIRMVPFSSISDRLYRVARLSAKDNDKRVALDIAGGHVEVDRGVIERIAAPLEHLLRNAIVHGIEPSQKRLDSGKPESGALHLEVRQEGNEVVLTLADDGAGLNIERIREKAISVGLMRENERLTDQQIGNFIFRSGFSTAGEVTTEAGRGVGMDVVLSEITALSGRVGTAF